MGIMGSDSVSMVYLHSKGDGRQVRSADLRGKFTHHPVRDSGQTHVKPFRHSSTRSLPDPVSRKSLKFVIARTSIFRSVSCVRVPTCGKSTFCGNASNRGFTRGSSGNTSRPTDAN